MDQLRVLHGDGDLSVTVLAVRPSQGHGNVDLSVGRSAILVNGLPGAGKTAVARPLAQALGLPLIGKDVIKERHADILGHDSPDGRPQREWNNLLGAAASETMWELLADSPEGAVLDSVWTRTVLDLVEKGLRRADVDVVLEVWCDVPENVARARCERRHADRHPIHGELPTDVEWAARWSGAEPLNVGPTLRIDTTSEVELDEVTAWVGSQLKRFRAPPPSDGSRWAKRRDGSP